MAAAMKRCPTHARLAHFLVSNPNIETAGFKTILCSRIPKDHSMLNFAQTVIHIMFLPSRILPHAWVAQLSSAQDMYKLMLKSALYRVAYVQ